MKEPCVAFLTCFILLGLTTKFITVIDWFATDFLVPLFPVWVGQFASLAVDKLEHIHPSVHLYVPDTFWPGWNAEFSVSERPLLLRERNSQLIKPREHQQQSFWVGEKVADNTIITGNVLPGARRERRFPSNNILTWRSILMPLQL